MGHRKKDRRKKDRREIDHYKTNKRGGFEKESTDLNKKRCYECHNYDINDIMFSMRQDQVRADKSVTGGRPGYEAWIDTEIYINCPVCGENKFKQKLKYSIHVTKCSCGCKDFYLPDQKDINNISVKCEACQKKFDLDPVR